MSFFQHGIANPLSLISRNDVTTNNPQDQSQQLILSDLGNNTNNSNDNNNNVISSMLKPENKDEFKLVLDQMCCAICLDILVNPQTIVPCGHTYCASCLVEIDNDQCPECRSSITSRVPALQLKGLIESLVQKPDIVNSSDIEHFQERKKKDQCQGVKVS
jgi:hypothetical protein